MATVTVTGGEGQPNILLTYDNGARNSAEAQSIADIISNQFGSVPASYNTPTPDSSPMGSDGYLVVTTGSPTLFDARGYQAVTFDSTTMSSFVLGGAAGGQTVLGGGGGGLDFVANYGNTLLDFAGGTNTFQDLGTTGSTVYGGNGGDTYDVGGADTIFAGTGATQVNLSGLGFVSLTGGAGAITVSGGNAGAAASTIVGGTSPLDVTLGTGNYSVTGSGAGFNTIVGGSGNETLAGGGNGDFIQAGSGNTSLVASTGAQTLVAGSGADTLSASTDPASTTILSFGLVSDNTTEGYSIANFNPVGLNGSTGDDIYVANATDANYILNTAHNDGNGNVVAQLNGGLSTITLLNTTIVGTGASATIDGQSLQSHIKT